MMTTRRQFLRRCALVSLSPWVPVLLPRSLQGAVARRDERILVVIQLDGGNDGLNTVIPFADENYARHRRELRIAEQDVLKLNDAVGLHPAMKPAAELFEDGRLTVVQGVGYPNPNRSHFRSMAIWQHARLEEHAHDSIGWLGRAADIARPPGSSAPDSIFVGEDGVPVALRGRRAHGIALANEADLELLRPESVRGFDASDDELSAYVARTLDRSYEAARQFGESAASSARDDATYPGTSLGRKLKLASRLIKLDGGTRVYYVSQPGYDTHAAQGSRHRQLLGELAGALRAFVDDLRESQLEERVAVLAFSEFGRRVQENGSAGTDHGAAGPVFVAGGAVRGGVIGAHPSLGDLDEGDLRMSIDFRRVYATLLERWLGIPCVDILGGSFAPLEIVSS
jgi:uncharacterized protein (DUF1501 family)